ncbi:hypothetical protein SERLA73DRAFT_156232 [Serpula lacrymans var. lacrymans S7.3]|uniref:Retrotransposon gag domain-containing protein n=1 Tax=Serpula lacrymans var. lacrymans (strain S7.3) TaxID=936435 RepID=F8QDJ8_SERL3|nr:hypothetical protein SERLA73DRAFT_156232 [Serpula lacrymans var. lacrymans S7.3]
MNTLLRNMRAQILSLTTQLDKIQAAPAAGHMVEWKFNKKLQVSHAVELVTRAMPMTLSAIAFINCILSRLKGPVAGQYAQVRLQECYTVGVWPTWDNLKVEIEKYFKPQAERDWARQQIRSFKQGNMRRDDYVTRFLALSIQGGLGNEHAVKLLEHNVNPRIAEQIYLQDTRNQNLALVTEEVQRVGRAMELYAMHQGGGSTC